MKRRERIGAVDEDLSSEDHHEVARQQEYNCRRQEVGMTMGRGGEGTDLSDGKWPKRVARDPHPTGDPRYTSLNSEVEMVIRSTSWSTHGHFLCMCSHQAYH
ncbi:hypothetical protein WN943_025494 [Citrus x changshan-huyou]